MGRPTALWIGLGAAAALLAAAGLGAFWLKQAYERPGPLAAETVLIVPAGAGVGEIAADLVRAGVIAGPWTFRALVRLTGADRGLRAGEYAFAAGVPLKAVIEKLHSGDTVRRRFTVIEGSTRAAVATALAAHTAMSGPMPALPTEGWLAPDTYFYSYGDGREALVRRMHGAQDAKLAELWRRRSPGLPYRTPEEAVILASIVEKETALPAERPRIAAVFVNRLRRGMRLQSDPTVIYALTGGVGELGRDLTRDDLATPSPYNTYAANGLPPGAICNPGEASLAAALNPAATGDLYFVADGEGGHAFAETLDEHNRNVARWRKRPRERQP
jgi:UPF0755 protein